MLSRYNFMKPSNCKDPVDGEIYPDPLTFNINKLRLSALPEKVTLSSVDIQKFWYFIYKFYGSFEGDDIILLLNNVMSKGLLKPGDELYLIYKNDFNNLI